MGIFDRVRTFLSSVFRSSDNDEPRRVQGSRSATYFHSNAVPRQSQFPHGHFDCGTDRSYRSSGLNSRDATFIGSNSAHSTTRPPSTSSTFGNNPLGRANDKIPESSASRIHRNTNVVTRPPSTSLKFGNNPLGRANDKIPESSVSRIHRNTNDDKHFSRPTSISKYSIKNITLTPQSKPLDANFICQKDVLYHDQWTTAEARIYDIYGNQSNVTGSVHITSQDSGIEFRNARLRNSSLHFSVKAIGGGAMKTLTITINPYSDNNVVKAAVNVVYSPCSNVLSKVTFIEMDGNECIYRVHYVDVFGNPAVNSRQISDLNIRNIDSNSENRVTHVIKQQNFASPKYVDFNVEAERPWSNKIAVFLSGKQLDSAKEYEFQGDEKDTLVRLCSGAVLAKRNTELSIPSNIVYDEPGGRVFLPVPQHFDDGQFLPCADDDMCQILPLPDRSYKLVCNNTTKYVVMGPDFANVNNIKRALDLSDRLSIAETGNETSILFPDSNLASQSRRSCIALVLHLLRGTYYRKKASECAKLRMKWKDIFNILDEILPTPTHASKAIKFCKYFKDHYGNLMNKYNREACSEIFAFFNYNREESEVDLHGLLVADEKRLNVLKLDMLRGSLDDDEIDEIIKNSFKQKTYQGRKVNSVKGDLMRGCLPIADVDEFIRCCNTFVPGNEVKRLRDDFVRRCNRANDVNKMIDNWRKESDEAIRMLERKLEDFDLDKAVEQNSPWVEIIVGAGHHSRMKEKQNIRPKVEKFLKEKGHTFTVVNKGSLVVRFIEYSGPEPCFGEYYCVTCDRCWKSSKSYRGKYQKCSRCHQECWPVKQRKKEKVCNYRREGMEKQRKSKPHQTHLCQRCKELGYPCNEEHYGSDYVIVYE